MLMQEPASFLLRNGIFPAISVNKGCHSHQHLQASNVSQWALETQEGKTPAISSHQIAATPYTSPEETQDVKTQDTGPR